MEGIQLTQEAEGLRVEVHVVVQPLPFPALAEVVRVASTTRLRGLGARVTAADACGDALRRPEEERPYGD